MISQPNKDWHHAIEQSYRLFLEQLTALNEPGIKLHWQQFKQLLAQHLDFEEQAIMPLAEKQPSKDKQLVEADHLILNKLLLKAEQAISSILQSSAMRRELVEQLDTFMRLRNVLRHHHEREQSQLYPLIESTVDEAQLQLLGQQMQSALAQLHTQSE